MSPPASDSESLLLAELDGVTVAAVTTVDTTMVDDELLDLHRVTLSGFGRTMEVGPLPVDDGEHILVDDVIASLVHEYSAVQASNREGSPVPADVRALAGATAEFFGDALTDYLPRT